MRVKHKVNVQISDDADGSNKLFYPDDVASQVSIDAFAHWDSGSIAIIGGLTPTTVTLNFGHVALPKGIFLRFKGCDPQIALNGGAALQLRRPTTETDATCRFFWEGDITAVTVTAPAGVTVTGYFAVWGDPAT